MLIGKKLPTSINTLFFFLSAWHWKWRHKNSSKCRGLFTDRHDITTQMTCIFYKKAVYIKPQKRTSRLYTLTRYRSDTRLCKQWTRNVMRTELMAVNIQTLTSRGLVSKTRRTAWRWCNMIRILRKQHYVTKWRHYFKNMQ